MSKVSRLQNWLGECNNKWVSSIRADYILNTEYLCTVYAGPIWNSYSWSGMLSSRPYGSSNVGLPAGSGMRICLHKKQDGIKIIALLSSEERD